MVKVKICGIRNLEDARDAIAAGADALGFIFFRGSPRYVNPLTAARIIRQLPKRVKKIGVFVNARPATIKRYARQCSLDMAQLHGNESAKVCGRCAPVPVIKAFRVRGAVDPALLAGYKTHAVLFDAYVPGRPGGTGVACDWALLKDARKCGAPGGVFLSGGLTSRNVRKAIRMVKPQWVDASSSLELYPGKKDRIKMAAFVRAVKHPATAS
ncbi:MAG: phosphoribosylanthranilate isomerase [Candidatus Omnitrophota bacterium]